MRGATRKYDGYTAMKSDSDFEDLAKAAKQKDAYTLDGGIIDEATLHISASGTMAELFGGDFTSSYTWTNQSPDTFKTYHRMKDALEHFGTVDNAFILSAKIESMRNTTPANIGVSIQGSNPKTSMGDGKKYSVILPKNVMGFTTVDKKIDVQHPGKDSAFARYGAKITLEDLRKDVWTPADPNVTTVKLGSTTSPIAQLVDIYAQTGDIECDKSMLRLSPVDGSVEIPKAYVVAARAHFIAMKEEKIPTVDLSKGKFPIKMSIAGDLKKVLASTNPTDVHTIDMVLKLEYQLNDKKAAEKRKTYVEAHA